MILNAIKVIGSMLFLVVGLAVIMAVVGITIESAAQYNDERDRCMRQATNGYEIERCR